MVVHMKRAYWKDIWRTVTKEKKRFISIAVIAALGVTMMCGLRAACVDLRYSADRFYDEQNLFDVRVLSTLGLTDEDMAALQEVEGVADVDGGYNETIYTNVDGMKKSIDVRTLSEKDFNTPYILEGELPQAVDEIAITENFVHQTGLEIGDVITLDEEGEYLISEEYKITGVIIDALDVNSSEGAMGFRSTSSTDYVGYVTPEAADNDIYTVIYLALEGTKELNCYTDEYEQKLETVVNRIESQIKAQREQARYDEVYNEAMEEWLDGEQEMKEEFAKADKEIADAKKELADGKKKLADARKEIEDGKKQIEDGLKQLESQEKLANAEFKKARQEIQDGYDKIISGKEELANAYEQLQAGQQQLDAGKEELTAQQTVAEEQFVAAYAQLDAAKAEAEEGYATAESQVNTLNQQVEALKLQLQDESLPEATRAELEATLAVLEEQQVEAQAGLEAAKQQVEAGLAQIEEQRSQVAAQEEAANAQFAAAWEEIEKSEAELQAGMEQYEAGAAELESANAQLIAGEIELNKQEKNVAKQIADGRKQLEDGKKEIEDGEKELADGEKELADGEKELNENVVEYETEKAKAEKELADAKEEIDDIDMTKWYVQDRFSLSGCANVKSDAASIQAIGDVFPVLFLTVAILISLTTITRMVDEERGLIGTYKALGFTNKEIRRKYIIYAAAACLIGGLIGDLGGYVILPAIIFIVFRVMYILPTYYFQFDLLYGLGGILLFEVGILIATVYACRKMLKKTPATLMRPKSPKAGSRVLLERITFIWKRLSFLNKVTARNLFRYKKRLFMTVFGIAGCMALLLCGFTIKNTVSEMMPQQYQNVYQYDMIAVASDDEFDKLDEKMKTDEEVEDYIAVRVESIEIMNEENTKETLQLIVVPEGDMLKSYIDLKNEDNEHYTLEDGDIFLTHNAMRILGFEEGDTVIWQNLDLVQVEAPVTKTVENYLGNMAYMTEATYRELFDTYEINGVLAHFSEKCEDQSAYTDELAREEGILSAMSTEAMEAEFEPAFALINMVVYVVLVLAALLAFAVLFTLSNTNISERERELATIKVLGFYNPEVHAYVNKETMILTALGILFGMPAGLALGRYIMGILEFPSLQFYITLYPESYAIAGGITIIFALMVNFITNKTLNKINMIEALKSVE